MDIITLVPLCMYSFVEKNGTPWEAASISGASESADVFCVTKSILLPLHRWSLLNGLFGATPPQPS